MPPSNGGQSNWIPSLSGVTPYGFQVTYTCDTARKLQRFITLSNGTVTTELYDEQSFRCQWNQTWSPDANVDSCVWTQCIEPYYPSGYNLKSVWEEHPVPVEFGDFVEFECAHEGLWFEHDRDVVSLKSQCKEDGFFEEPQPWHRCVRSKKTQDFNLFSNNYLFSYSFLATYCTDPPAKPRGGTQYGSKNASYNTEVE